MHESKITAKGQTTLPRDVREALNLKSGDFVRYVILDDQVRFLKVQSVKQFEGVLERPGQKRASLKQMEEAIARGAIESGAPKE